MSAGCGTTTTRSYMPGIFEALANLPKRGPKKHFVNIDGVKIEVSLERSLEIMKRGQEYYMLEDGEIVLKPIPKMKSKFRKLLGSNKGYHFVDNDIHWPEEIGEGGKTWQIEYE